MCGKKPTNRKYSVQFNKLYAIRFESYEGTSMKCLIIPRLIIEAFTLHKYVHKISEYKQHENSMIKQKVRDKK